MRSIKMPFAVRIIIVTASVAMGSALLSAAYVQTLPSSSTGGGVYTTAQAQHGKVFYDKQCASCHGAELQGAGGVAPLTGREFLAKWDGRSLADLFIQTQATMPTSDPGSLSPEETTQLLAYILSSNQFPAGKVELPNELNSLKKIRINRPK